MSSRPLPNNESLRTADINGFHAPQRINYTRNIGVIIQRRLRRLHGLIRDYNTAGVTGPSITDIARELSLSISQAHDLRTVAFNSGRVGQNERGLFLVDHVEAQ